MKKKFKKKYRILRVLHSIIGDMAYSENTKDFNSIRTFFRELYVEGYKTRTDYLLSRSDKSARSIDNEMKRILSILNDDDDYDESENKITIKKMVSGGKKTFISIDSRKDCRNPIYKSLLAKRYDDAGLIMYFLTLDYLSDGRHEDLTTISRGVINSYDILYWGGGKGKEDLPTKDTFRNWLNKFVAAGVVCKEKVGNKELFFVNKDSCDYSDYVLPITFFSEVAPGGVIGSFILDNIKKVPKSIFRFKHHYIVYALDCDILCELLDCVSSHSSAQIELFKKPQNQDGKILTCTPIKIYSSTMLGRQYLLAYSHDLNSFKMIRLDGIKNVKREAVDTEFDHLKTCFESMSDKIWGMQLSDTLKPYKLSFTVCIEENETYILDRLKAEGRGGTITKLDDNHYRYERNVFDPNEMLPWLRTFYGRITELNCDDSSVVKKIKDDIEAMNSMYFGGGYGIQ